MELIIKGEKFHASRPNLACALDVVSLWGDGPNRAHMGRLCACALGLCVPALKLPKYNMIHADPIAYGGKALDHLLSRGVPAGEIYTHGMNVIVLMADLLPRAEEVEKAEEFLKKKEGEV